MQNNIPKIIHYCWFGDNEQTELVKKCIESWKTFLPDYDEVFKSFDRFLDLDFFTGYEKYEKDIHSFTAVVGAKKRHHIIKDLLDEYKILVLDFECRLAVYGYSAMKNLCQIYSFERSICKFYKEYWKFRKYNLLNLKGFKLLLFRHFYTIGKFLYFMSKKFKSVKNI